MLPTELELKLRSVFDIVGVLEVCGGRGDLRSGVVDACAASALIYVE